MPEEDGESESHCRSEIKEEIHEMERTGAQQSDDLEMEIIDTPSSDGVEVPTH